MGIDNLLLQFAILLLVIAAAGGIIGLIREKRTGHFHEREEDKAPRNSGTWGGG